MYFVYLNAQIDFCEWAIEYQKAHDKLYDDIQKLNRIFKPFNIK